VTPENPDPSAAALLALNARAVRASVQVVSQVRAVDLARPTPCGDWTLAQLIAHMTAQHDGFAAAAAGNGADLARWQPAEPAADPVREYAAAAERVLAAFGADGVLGRRFALPEISPRPFPAVQAIGFHLVDYVVHGWDVARSLGSGPYRLDPDLLSAALLIAQAVPDDERRRRPDAAFAPAVPAQDSLSPLDRIVALLGRRPHWPA
jgi:uncharacterized protein (TIGR03086 family)